MFICCIPTKFYFCWNLLIQTLKTLDIRIPVNSWAVNMFYVFIYATISATADVLSSIQHLFRKTYMSHILAEFQLHLRNLLNFQEFMNSWNGLYKFSFYSMRTFCRFSLNPQSNETSTFLRVYLHSTHIFKNY